MKENFLLLDLPYINLSEKKIVKKMMKKEHTEGKFKKKFCKIPDFLLYHKKNQIYYKFKLILCHKKWQEISNNYEFISKSKKLLF